MMTRAKNRKTTSPELVAQILYNFIQMFLTKPSTKIAQILPLSTEQNDEQS